jgi:hypothetical protein
MEDRRPPADAPTPPRVVPGEAGQPLAKIVARDRIITVVRARGEVRYRVEDADGRVVLALATLDELRAEPVAYEIVRSSVARSGSVYLDATLDRRAGDAPR